MTHIMKTHVRTCQECGHQQVARDPATYQSSDNWRNLKCRKCRSIAMDYGSPMDVDDAGKVIIHGHDYASCELDECAECEGYYDALTKSFERLLPIVKLCPVCKLSELVCMCRKTS